MYLVSIIIHELMDDDMLCRDHMNGYDCSVNVDGDGDDASDDVVGDDEDDASDDDVDDVAGDDEDYASDDDVIQLGGLLLSCSCGVYRQQILMKTLFQSMLK